MTNAYITTQTLLKSIFYLKLKQQININLELLFQKCMMFFIRKEKMKDQKDVINTRIQSVPNFQPIFHVLGQGIKVRKNSN